MTTFNPPYSMDTNFNNDMEAEPVHTLTDKDGNVVDKSEVEAYGASLEVTPETSLTV